MTNCCGMFLMQNLRRLAQALVTTFKFSYKVCTNLTIKLLLNVSFWSEKNKHTAFLSLSLSDKGHKTSHFSIGNDEIVLCSTHKYNHFDTDAETFINQHEHSAKHLLLHSTEEKKKSYSF